MSMQKYQLKLLVPVFYLLIVCAYFTYLFVMGEYTIHFFIGALMTIIAFGLWITARVQLGDSFSIAPHAKKLVTTGLYSKLRHPVYYFSILALTGLAVALWNIVIACAVFALIAVEIVRLREEENVLLHKFGDEYVAYKKATWF